MTRPCASRTLLSSCLRGQCRLTLWGTLDARAEPTWPRQAFSSIAAMYPVLASATAPAISVRSRLGPNVDGVAAGFKEVSYYHRVTPCGPENRARRTPVRAGVASATVANVGGRCIQATRDRWFPESGLCSHRCGPWGLWIRFSTRSAGVTWTLNKYTPAKGV